MKTILIVGDASARKLLSSVLTPSYAVAEATDGARAENFIKTFTPDLALVDLRLAGLHAAPLIEECGKRKTPLILVTACPEAITAPAANVLAIPFSAEQLLDAVRCALDPSQCVRRAPVKHGGATGANILSLIAVGLLAVLVFVQLFVMLPSQKQLLLKQREIEIALEDQVRHEALMKEARKREATNQAKLLVHQELALKLLKRDVAP